MGFYEEYFLARVNQNGPVVRGVIGPCWIWTAGLTHYGYGAMCVRGKYTLAHRYSYAHHTGEDIKGKDICHRCDRPACVNPDHLFAGTAYDNANDMTRKGRGATAKLTPDNVREIRRLLKKLGNSKAVRNEIGAKFGVQAQTIQNIVAGRTWYSVPMEDL